jgi:hypothetical protein
VVSIPTTQPSYTIGFCVWTSFVLPPLLLLDFPW